MSFLESANYLVVIARFTSVDPLTLSLDLESLLLLLGVDVVERDVTRLRE